MISSAPAPFPLTGREFIGERRRRRGQAMAEFALILPLFLLLSIGVVDLARVFASYISLTDGVREAALYASAGPENPVKWCDSTDPDAIPCPPTTDPAVNESANPDNIAFQITSTGLDSPGIRMDDPVCTMVNGECSTIMISAAYDVDLLTPVVGGILGSQITLRASTTAVVLP